MSRILFRESYIVIVPSFDKTATHKHPFMHLFFGQNKCTIKTDKKELQGNIILIDSNKRHAVEPGNDCNFFLLIDPTSAIAEQMKEQYIKDCFYHEITSDIVNVPEDINRLSEKEIIRTVEYVLSTMGISTEKNGTKDERIEQVIDKIISGEWLSYGATGICMYRA